MHFIFGQNLSVFHYTYDTEQAFAYLETAKSWIFNRNSSYTSTT